MRLTFITTPDRGPEWVEAAEARGWVAEWFPRAAAGEPAVARPPLMLADVLILDLGDAGSNAARELGSSLRTLGRPPDALVVPASSGIEIPGTLMLHAEDGPRRSAEILGLWTAAGRPAGGTQPGGGLPFRGDTAPGPVATRPADEPMVPGRDVGVPWMESRSFDGLCHALARGGAVEPLAASFARSVADLYGLARYILFLGDQDDTGWMTPVASFGVDEARCAGLRLSCRSGVGRMVADHHTALRRAGLDRSDSLHNEAARELEWLGLDAAIPVAGGDSVVGILVVGRRLSGAAPSPAAVESMAALCRHLGTAVREARTRAAREEDGRLDPDALHRLRAGVLAADVGGRVLRINPRARVLLGLAESVPARTLEDLPAYVADRVREVAATGEPVSAHDLADPVTGRLLDLEIEPWDDGDRRRAIATFWERTEAAADDERERDSWERALIQRLAERSSHELANTLVALRTFAELLPEQYDNAEFRTEFSAVVGQEVGRVQRFLDVLDWLAHPPDGTGQDVELAEVFESVQASLRLEFGGRVRDDGVTVVRSPGGRPVEIEIDVADSAASLHGSAPALTGALLQIMRNGVQAMSRGGVVAVRTARVRAADSGGSRIRITVEDEGEGILLTHQDRIFDPFYTTKHVGTGLGLTIARAAVRSCGGRIEVDSTRGRGTRVTVMLPAGPGAEVPASEPAEGSIDLPEPGDIRLGSDRDRAP